MEQWNMFHCSMKCFISDFQLIKKLMEQTEQTVFKMFQSNYLIQSM